MNFGGDYRNYTRNRWLATIGNDGVLHFWALDNKRKQVQVLSGTPEEVVSIGFGPEGRWFAAGSSDGTARFWDLDDADAEPRELPRRHDRPVATVAFDPSGRWLATQRGNLGSE